jgi:hypothetical protein
MAKDTRIPIRLPSALKEEFEWAAERDGCTRGVSTWLRQLGEQRAEELRDADRPPMTPEERTEAQRAINAHLAQHAEILLREVEPAVEPAPLEFVPGLGLEEE